MLSEQARHFAPRGFAPAPLTTGGAVAGQALALLRTRRCRGTTWANSHLAVTDIGGTSLSACKRRFTRCNIVVSTDSPTDPTSKNDKQPPALGSFSLPLPTPGSLGAQPALFRVAHATRSFVSTIFTAGCSRFFSPARSPE